MIRVIRAIRQSGFYTSPYDRHSTGHVPDLVFHQGYQGNIQQQLPSNEIPMPPSFENKSKNGVAERLAAAHWDAHKHVSATHKVFLDCFLLRSRFRIAHLPRYSCYSTVDRLLREPHAYWLVSSLVHACGGTRALLQSGWCRQHSGIVHEISAIVTIRN